MNKKQAHQIALKSAKLAYDLTMRKLADDAPKPGTTYEASKLTGKKNPTAKEKKEIEDAEDKGLEGAGKTNKATKDKLGSVADSLLNKYSQLSYDLELGDDFNKSKSDLAVKHQREMDELAKSHNKVPNKPELGKHVSRRPTNYTGEVWKEHMGGKDPGLVAPSSAAHTGGTERSDTDHVNPFSDEHLKSSSASINDVVKLADYFASKL